jgi:nitronate monooxygenase
MIHTRLTEKFSLSHPIISAPMAFAATGNLATAVSKAGGLGLIGGGYGDLQWVKEQFSSTSAEDVGCGFITWALNNKPEVLEASLDFGPRALLLSFGNPRDYARKIKDRNIPLICQVQTFKDARNALECGADIIVAQGSEAGGHGEKRATISLVPEVADLISIQYPEALLCAAGGIADGRGLAAALMLGADGVLMGSRLWASKEANVSKHMHKKALNATGDATIRTSVMDVVRSLNWPDRYTARVLKNSFTDRWHNNLEGLRKDSKTEAPQWTNAWKEGDPENSNTFVGEATGLINEIESIESIIDSTIAQAKGLLEKQWL